MHKKNKPKTNIPLTQLQLSFDKDLSTEGEDSPRPHLHKKPHQKEKL